MKLKPFLIRREILIIMIIIFLVYIPVISVHLEVHYALPFVLLYYPFF